MNLSILPYQNSALSPQNSRSKANQSIKPISPNLSFKGSLDPVSSDTYHGKKNNEVAFTGLTDKFKSGAKKVIGSFFEWLVKSPKPTPSSSIKSNSHTSIYNANAGHYMSQTN